MFRKHNLEQLFILWTFFFIVMFNYIHIKKKKIIILMVLKIYLFLLKILVTLHFEKMNE